MGTLFNSPDKSRRRLQPEDSNNPATCFLGKE